MNLSSTYYKKCFVPTCKNTTFNSNKTFVVVKETLKMRWCKQANVYYRPGRRLFCCEDHLKLEEDLENYLYYKLMKGKPVLKSSAKLRGIQDLPLCSQTENIVAETAPTLKSLLQVSVTRQIESTNEATPTIISASTHVTKINAATQYEKDTREQGTSTKGLKHIPKSSQLQVSPSSSLNEFSLSPSLQGFTTDTESTTTHTKELPAKKQILEFIEKDPKAYIGLPKQYFWLIKYIVTDSKTKINELDIIITLIKIKLNDPVYRICDQFQISRGTYTTAMHNGVQVLASFFQDMIYMPNLTQIKRNQPLTFKIRYSNVQLLLDAFEIEIQKPQNPTRQAQTWSQYKNANTVKYLVGSTPNGFIAFISKGYGGRISDKALVEKSCLIDNLPDNAVIMADRGFKEIEALLMVKGIKLLRPPSVYASIRPSKEEVLQTKIVASLRVHIERVIRRIREFRFLKAHSVISHKHVGYLDHVVLIACGLVNLQNDIIKFE